MPRRKASPPRPEIATDTSPGTTTSLSGTTADLPAPPEPQPAAPDPYAGQWASICLTVILPAQQFTRFGEDLEAFLSTHASTREESDSARLIYCTGFGSGVAAWHYIRALADELDRMEDNAPTG